MEVIKTHLIFIRKQNGPSSFQTMEEVLETKDGYYFYKNTSGYFQITKKIFDISLKLTLEIMPELHVEFSQPRKIKSN